MWRRSEDGVGCFARIFPSIYLVLNGEEPLHVEYGMYLCFAPFLYPRLWPVDKQEDDVSEKSTAFYVEIIHCVSILRGRSIFLLWGADIED